MTDELANALSRIDRALKRIEALPRQAANDTSADGRYQRLRQRTQSALAELDAVISRVSAQNRR
jgi:hypothetical protein